ncbi:MAG: UPF0182 family protein [Thermomicrobiales bacterium]|nr:UPF0182 family protein [Thermomicrobiales bacterium]
MASASSSGRMASAKRKSFWTPSKSTIRMLIAAAIIVGLFLLLTATSSFWVNWWWFSSMDRRSLLTDRYLFQGISFLLGALLTALIFGGNLILALRRTRQQGQQRSVTRVSNRILFWLVIIATAVLAAIVGARASAVWELWAKWRYGSSFGYTDPYLDRDIGFYIFAMPALQWIHNALFVIVLLALAGTLIVYLLRTSLRFSLNAFKRAPEVARTHVTFLLGLVALLFAFGRVLAFYGSVHASGGVAGGPGFVDMNVTRWANLVAAICALVAAITLFIAARRFQFRLLVGALVGLGAVLLFGVIVLPRIVQSVFVDPSEELRQRSFIANNLEMTRAAYALDTVNMRESSGQQPMTSELLQTEQVTLENIRLWDYRLAGTTFQQLQSFVPFYSFPDVDLGNYVVDGQPLQVLLAARELDQSGLPSTSRNWTNTHLVYTHGYAAVVAPVGEVSAQGLPVMIVSNIPPNGTGQFAITRPEIYFGAADSDWIILNTNQDEFSGIDSSDDVTRYQGVPAGGIELGGIFKRIVLGSYLGDRNTVISGALSGDSILVLDRSVLGRIAKLTPFLELDDDPYMVIDNGRLYWIVDAYTTSDDFPAAQQHRGVNYMRNSVKVVVDAYTGEVTYYRTETFDPIADVYGRMFDNLFVPIADAPAGIASHFRYPVRLFELQSEIFATAHVTNPTAYFNGEDRWSIATETIEGSVQTMEPYYVTMRLPGDTDPTYSLIRPFVPGGSTDRQNLTAWMSGRITPEGQLEIIVYRFPRQETVFGPRQIEGRISQEPDISSQISLWNQSGTQVIMGNMLVIPVEQSILYVQPLYLRATSVENALPELQRVIVATNERVVMRDTLQEAIEAVVSVEPAVDVIVEPEPEVEDTTTGDETPPEAGGATDINALAQQAVNLFEAGQTALAQGDWAAYGAAQEELEAVLAQIANAAIGASATPEP